jgi:hypothetical protein
MRMSFNLVLRILVNVPLYLADYFYFYITIYEETVIDVIICQVSHYILNP